MLPALSILHLQNGGIVILDMTPRLVSAGKPVWQPGIGWRRENAHNYRDKRSDLPPVFEFL
ncbi:MAG TPA: hypothetical protein DEG76_02965 [Pseudohongiella sp.]|nr:hypothetical protein [Pseudohongiella sp.]HBX36310.1 hypothetical protein [Pseudohongiella sp.]|tara:strand:+ start:911 stop:1093 length:183 start_codon:yes stop_codon:yes gene_type:complete